MHSLGLPLPSYRSLSPSGEPLYLLGKQYPTWELDPLTEMSPFSHHICIHLQDTPNPHLCSMQVLSGTQARDSPERGGDSQGVNEKVRAGLQATTLQPRVGLDVRAVSS